MMKARCVLGVAVAAVVAAAGLAWAAQGSALNVTVNYTGPGDVDATHAIYLALYDTPDIAGGAVPIAAQIVTANGQTAEFSGVAASPVYLSALFDINGGWDGLSAVPSGSPAATWRPLQPTPTPIELAAGETVDLEFSFNAAFRMP
ncbi:MAG: hypothetical protein F4Y57_11015 [Acidobacteria bacterium]|nr:hypothetical protein [Acidobacteriota bacterium]